MNDAKLVKKYLPLTESTYYIMLSLVEPLHGYGIMQYTQKCSNGAVKLGPGTLYGALSKLESEKLIILMHAGNRRKSYQLTEKGKRVLCLEVSRLKNMLRSGTEAISRMEGKTGGSCD